MQITEFFTLQLEAAMEDGSKGNLAGFLPVSHTSLPDFQENMLYLCAHGHRTLNVPDYFSIRDIDAFLLLYVESGTGFAETDGETVSLPAGSMLLWDCKDYLQIKAAYSAWEVNLLFFSGKSVPVYYEEICKLRFPRFQLPADSTITGNLKQLMSLGTETSPHHAILTNRLLTNLLSDLLLMIHIPVIDEKPVPVYLREIHQLFDTRYQENYSVEQLAEHYHVSRYRLCREFSRFYGTTPLKYLNDVRLTHSKELLETTSLRIHEVGSAVGIDNPTHFINLFKAKMGITPMAYRDGYLSFRAID